MNGLIAIFDAYVSGSVANGRPSKDTVASYRSALRFWLRWCSVRHLAPATASESDVIAFRQELVRSGYKSASVGHKLTVVGQFYRALGAEGLRSDNPAEGIGAPKDPRAAEDLLCLDESALRRVLGVLPRGGSPKERRDQVLVLLMALHGLRTVECQRASVEDLRRRPEGVALLVHGKGRDRLLWLRQDVAAELEAFVKMRCGASADRRGTPLFAAASNRAGGSRLSRRGIRKIVDGYLKACGLKRPRSLGSCSAAHGGDACVQAHAGSSGGAGDAGARKPPDHKSLRSARRRGAAQPGRGRSYRHLGGQTALNVT